MAHLFEPFTLRGVTLRNRIGVSPMCQYSCKDGLLNDWHLVHLGARAVGGAGLVMVEATAVVPEGRISPQDAGLWSDAHGAPLARISAFLRDHGAVPAIQLAHAGRKASTHRPWDRAERACLTVDEGGWPVVAPSPIAFAPDYPAPQELDETAIARVTQAFCSATQRAVDAGFTWVELHAAHGYLAHSFLSPLSNKRTDRWGGGFDNRVRFVIETVTAMRRVLPDDKVLSVRLSATDWVEGGWTLDDSVDLAKRLKPLGVDLIDCSSGAIVPGVHIPVGAGYQVPLAERVRRQAEIPVAAVGMITEPMHADEVVRNGRADLVLLAKEMLRDPYWPLRAAKVLRATEALQPPIQYAAFLR